MFQLILSPPQLQVLTGLLDVAIKAVGIRAMEDDVVDLMRAVKVAAPFNPPAPEETAADETAPAAPEPQPEHPKPPKPPRENKD